MSIDQTERKKQKGKAMSIEHTIKVTCDGCGKSVTFNFDRDDRETFEPWFQLDIQVSVRKPAGQSIRQFPLEPRLDACSEACAQKVLSEAKFSVPSVPPKSA